MIAKTGGKKFDAADYREGVGLCIKVAADLGLTPEETNLLFGIEPKAAGNLEDLQGLLESMLSRDVEARCERIISIKTRLETIFPHDIESQKKYLVVVHELLGGRTIKSFMVSGDFAELDHADAIIARITG